MTDETRPPDDDAGRLASARPKFHLRHELRTPLGQIIGYAELLAETTAEDGQAQYVPDLERIIAAGKRLLAVIDMLDPGTITVRQPAAPPSPVAAPAPHGSSALETIAPPDTRAMPPASPLSRWSLLVVDDNEANRDMLSRRLRSRGYRVDAAADGRSALDLLGRRKFDLVLLDIMMPEISGLDVLRTVRTRSSVADLPIIMVTARDQSEDTVEALRLGANDYVTKPLDFPVVLARLETQLSLKAAAEEIRRLAHELEKHNRFIRETFGRYLSDEVVANLLETPEGLALGGEKRRVTILLCDLRGFTPLAERLAPEQVVRVLNNYLGAMADVIASYNGTIDEFIGDSVLALFGAPITRPDDARRAAACALAMQETMALVNQRNRDEDLPPVEMGVAINTGEVVVGNIGSARRLKYGVVGTPINLAARIQAATAAGQILISEATLAAAGAGVATGERRLITAKGFSDPVAVFELRAIEPRPDPALFPSKPR